MIPKFRAFLKDTNQILDVEIIFFDGVIKTENNDFYQFEDIILMQFTGLHDNTKFKDLSEKEQVEWLESGKTADEWQGREVFEGDIVKPRIGNPFVVKHFVFGQGVFKTALITSDGHGFDGIYHGSLVKVIGNVEQNLELLEAV